MLKFLKKHYHWIIAAVALLQLLIYGGAVNNFSGYHLIPVTEGLEISRTAFSLANSLRSVVGLFSTLFSGVLIHRFGHRRTAAAGLVIAGAAYVVYATMDSYWQLLVGSAMMGLAAGVCASGAVSRLLNSWFHKYRGTVLGIVTAATGVGSTVLGLVQTWAIENVSWRMSFTIAAGLQLGLAVLVYLLVRNIPEDMGLRPFGEGQLLTDVKKSNASRWAGYTMEQLKKKPAFYLMHLCALLSCVCVLATQYNLVPYMQDCGMSATRTGKIYGTMMLLLGIIKLSMGALCDAIGPKRVAILCHVACAAGLTLVMTLPQTDGAMIGALIVYDLCIPLTTMMFPLLSVELFGYHAQSQYIGTIMAMTQAANILSAPMANAVRDTMGSYAPAFWVVAAVALGLIALYGLLFSMAGRDKKKLQEAE